ncbi:putative fad binding domain-containing protein [Ilyonectria robusta]
MAQPTESDILAALARYRTHIAEVTHRAMLRILPVVEAARLKKTYSRVTIEEEEERRFKYLSRLIALPEGNTQPPIKRPSDVLEHWDLIASQVSLDGTTVNDDPEWRAAKREMYRSAILEGLGHLECPTGQWTLPPDFEILMQHVDGLEGHGWSMLRDVSERLIFWVGWGSEGVLETYESIQQRVMTGEAILDEMGYDETDEYDEMRDYDIAGGWLSGEGGESGVYVIYSRLKDESEGWSWRYVAAQGQFGTEIFDNIVAVLDWYKGECEPVDIELKINAKDVFAP